MFSSSVSIDLMITDQVLPLVKKFTESITHMDSLKSNTTLCVMEQTHCHVSSDHFFTSFLVVLQTFQERIQGDLRGPWSP